MVEAILVGVYKGEQGLLFLRQGEPFHILHVLERQGDTVFLIRDAQVFRSLDDTGSDDDESALSDVLMLTVLAYRGMKGRC